MTAKMMTGNQVNFLKKLIEERLVPPDIWAKILKELKVEKEDDLFHLNVEQASGLIYTLVMMPNK